MVARVLTSETLHGSSALAPSPLGQRSRRSIARAAVVAALAASAAGCSVVRHHHVRPDWPAEDQRRVRRLAVLVHPLPAGDAKAGEVFARVARRYVNMKRDFLVKHEVVAAEAPQPATLCGGDERIEGVLTLAVDLRRVGEGFEATLRARLARCDDLREAWSAESAGSFPSRDDGLREVTDLYARELGPEAAPYVAPAMNLLRPTLDTLPRPELDDEAKDEKLSLD